MQNMEFSKKVLEFLGNEPDEKMKPEELMKYVPKLMNIVDTGGGLQTVNFVFRTHTPPKIPVDMNFE